VQTTPKRRMQEVGSRKQEAGRHELLDVWPRPPRTPPGRLRDPATVKVSTISVHPPPTAAPTPHVIICSYSTACLPGLWPSADTWPAACCQLKIDSAWGGYGVGGLAGRFPTNGGG
jgi:hypothetical protein